MNLVWISEFFFRQSRLTMKSDTFLYQHQNGNYNLKKVIMVRDLIRI